MLYFKNAIIHLAFDNGLIACVDLFDNPCSRYLHPDLDLEEYKSNDFRVAIFHKESNNYLPVKNFMGEKIFGDTFIKQEYLPEFLAAVKNATEEDIKKKG